MGQPTPHPGAILIVGMLSAWPELFDRAAEALAARFGAVRRRSADIPFTFTDYYEPQMGRDLLRRFYSFDGPFDPSRLPETKLWTNELEVQLAGPAYPVARPVNLDPGCVDAARLVLATTKDNAHRIYLGQGIYAEITLNFLHGHFQPLPWTYPDYRTAPYLEFLTQVRGDVVQRIEPPSPARLRTCRQGRQEQKPG